MQRAPHAVSYVLAYQFEARVTNILFNGIRNVADAIVRHALRDATHQRLAANIDQSPTFLVGGFAGDGGTRAIAVKAIYYRAAIYAHQVTIGDYALPRNAMDNLGVKRDACHCGEPIETEKRGFRSLGANLSPCDVV